MYVCGCVCIVDNNHILHVKRNSVCPQPLEDSGAQLIWLQGLCDSLVNEQRVHLMRGFYSLLSAMLDLCHSSVEPQIPKIWRTFLEQKVRRRRATW